MPKFQKNIFEWTKLTGYYFLERSNLRTVFLLLDSRREIFAGQINDGFFR